MIRTQRHSRFVLMSLDEIRATRDIVLQTEETKSNFSGSGKTVYICEVVRPCDYQKETDTAADKLAAEIERVNADNRALRRKVERLERELPEILMLCVSELAGGVQYFAIPRMGAKSESGFKRHTKRRRPERRLSFLFRRVPIQAISTILYTTKRKFALFVGGFGLRTKTATPPIPRPSLLCW